VAERVKAPLLAACACAVALGLLAIAAYSVGPVESFDAKTLVHLSLAIGSRPYELAESVAYLADPAPLLAMLLAVCALALACGRRREALAAVVVVAGANVTTQLLKGLLAHPRYQPYAGYHQPWSNAFPSGHMTAAASIAVALAIAAPRGARPLAIAAGFAFAGAVGLAVVALEWHYPSDVVGAILVAAGWGFAALAGLRAFEGPGRDRSPAPLSSGAAPGPAPSYRG